jgi:hypothetical protein
MTNGKTLKPYTTLIDFITGKVVPDVGAEANRQAVERYLVNHKGYRKADIEVDADIALSVAGERYRSRIDLVVRLEERRLLAIKCAAGSLGSRQREILAAARLMDRYQIPLSVVSDGATAAVLDTATGKLLGEGLEAIPTRDEALEMIRGITWKSYPADRLEREKLIFRSYDSMNVNVGRNL